MVNLVWAIAILAALIGMALLAYSVWRPIRAWRRRGKACLRCGYPAPCGATPVARCPECGTEYGATPSLPRRVVGLSIGLARVAIGVLLLCPLATLIWPFRAAGILEPLFVTWTETSRTALGTSDFVQEEMEFRGDLLARAAQELQRVNVFVGMEAGALQRGRVIDPRGNVAFETQGRSVQIGSPFAPGTSVDTTPGEFASVSPGTDIDADATPDIIVSTFSGGAHCCWEYAVIALGDAPKATFKMDSAVGARFTLDPGPSGPTTLIQTADTTWAYWRTSYVESPMPRVTMRLAAGSTRVVASAMREPAPSPDELATEAARVRELIRADRASAGDKEMSVADYWRTPLELMYSGHEDLAWKFFDDAWPRGVAGKDEFLKDFRGMLEQSIYWGRVREAFARE